MRGWGTSAKSLLFFSVFAFSSQVATPSADAEPSQQYRQANSVSVYKAPVGKKQSYRVAKRGKASAYTRQARAGGGGISCVPFARADSGIAVSGNAWQWWENAAGVYARGALPEPGAVLTFRSNGRMRLGHVAVVSRVVNPRQIVIEHANWAGPGGRRGAVARDTPVVDVSENNDWTAVRVGLGQTGDFGSVYPTYGFIYDRPDTGMMVAAKAFPSPQPVLNPAPADLRPATERGWQTYEEVAEAPAVTKHVKRALRQPTVKVQRVATARR